MTSSRKAQSSARNGASSARFFDDSRPDSSNLIELHIYLLPREVWITKQKLAYNETIQEAISAGFIRVPQDLILNELRNEIKKQCINEDIPPEYFFLRSVGRALTRCKPHQEFELKARSFLPPQNHGPEVFLLEYDKDITQEMMRKFDGVSSKRDGSSSNNSMKMREYEKLLEEQERLKNRQNELERQRQLQMELLARARQSNRSYYDDEMNGRASGLEDFTTDRNAYHPPPPIETSKMHHKGLSGSSDSLASNDGDDRTHGRKRALAAQLNSISSTSRNALGSLDPTNNSRTSTYNLKEKLNNTRDKREELERLREDLIKHLKQIHNRISVRRKEARDLWKKKYFNEKKKTPQLEERMNALLREIEQCQQKMFQSLENEIRNAASMGYNRESEVKHEWLVAIRLQEEIYLLRRQLDQQKLKLTTDIKLRNQAESESKALRTELAQTKMNLNQLKNNPSKAAVQ